MADKEKKSEDYMDFILKQLEKVSRADMLYRGVVIQKVSVIESQLDRIIATYFCYDDKEKQEELTYVLLASDKITLSSKYQIVSFIMHRHFKDFYKKYEVIPPKNKGKNREKNKSIDTRMNDIIAIRNKFAHRLLREISTEKVKNFSGTLNLDTKVPKDGQLITSELPVDAEYLQAFSKEVSELINILTKVRDLVNNKKKEG